MSESTGKKAGIGLWWAGAASVLIVGGAAWYSFERAGNLPNGLVGTDAEVATETAAASTEPDTAIEPSSTDASATSQSDTETAAAPDAAAPVAPAFDEVRRETDGTTIIAGTAAPGAVLSVLQNGAEISSITADGNGKFAAFLMIPPDGQGHVLSLAQKLNGDVIASEAEIILTPMEAVAEATPEPTSSATASQTVAANTGPQPRPARNQPAPDAPSIDAVLNGIPSSADAEPPASAAAVAQSAPDTPALDPVINTSDLQTDASDVAEVAAVSAPASAPATSAPAAPAVVLKSTVDGVELLNTTPPEVMNNVALDTISYSDIGEVQLAGRAQAEAQTVRVYLDNRPIADLPVDAEGRWRGDLPQIDEGVYTLRVDEVAADGRVTSRVETPFKRENRQQLLQASEGQDGPLKRITVQRGNTLWAIARERYGEGELYVRVFQANADDIRDPDLIYPGQVFNLPD